MVVGFDEGLVELVEQSTMGDMSNATKRMGQEVYRYRHVVRLQKSQQV